MYLGYFEIYNTLNIDIIDSQTQRWSLLMYSTLCLRCKQASYRHSYQPGCQPISKLYSQAASQQVTQPYNQPPQSASVAVMATCCSSQIGSFYPQSLWHNTHFKPCLGIKRSFLQDQWLPLCLNSFRWADSLKSGASGAPGWDLLLSLVIRVKDRVFALRQSQDWLAGGTMQDWAVFH